jgi:hypothetical protein
MLSGIWLLQLDRYRKNSIVYRLLYSTALGTLLCELRDGFRDCEGDDAPRGPASKAKICVLNTDTPSAQTSSMGRAGHRLDHVAGKRS